MTGQSRPGRRGFKKPGPAVELAGVDEDPIIPAVRWIHVRDVQLGKRTLIHDRAQPPAVVKSHQVDHRADSLVDAEAEAPILPGDLAVLDAEARTHRLRDGNRRGARTRSFRISPHSSLRRLPRERFRYRSPSGPSWSPCPFAGSTRRWNGPSCDRNHAAANSRRSRSAACPARERPHMPAGSAAHRTVFRSVKPRFFRASRTRGSFLMASSAPKISLARNGA